MATVVTPQAIAAVRGTRWAVDAEGKVHGLDNLYVVDGSVLPRSSRANPSLTIYAWALRVTERLQQRERTT